MLYELNNEGLARHNEAIRMINSNVEHQTPLSWSVGGYLNFYMLLPPICSTGIGYALIHPEINLNGLAGLAPGQNWNHENGDAFKRAFGPPLLGYLVGFLLWNSLQIIACTTKNERRMNTQRDPIDKILWNVSLALNKLSCLPNGSITNVLATTTLSAATSAAYALFGARMVGLIPDAATALDLAITNGVGGAVIPALVTSGFVVYKTLTFGELDCFPNPNYYQLNMTLCNTVVNIKACFKCCSHPKTSELLDAAYVDQEYQVLASDPQSLSFSSRASAPLLAQLAPPAVPVAQVANQGSTLPAQKKTCLLC